MTDENWIDITILNSNFDVQEDSTTGRQRHRLRTFPPRGDELQIEQDWIMGPPPKPINKSDAADAARFRWLINGNGYFLEENSLCGHSPVSDDEMNAARKEIDAAMKD